VSEQLQFLINYGYTVLFVWVLGEQLGLPIPAIPILLGAGALAASGHMSFTATLLVAAAAALSADLVWYELGRRRGMRVLNFLCRVSLEPDTCVRQTEVAYARHGLKALLIAKFVPGLNTAAPPLAGIFGTPFWRFLAFDMLGIFIWVGSLFLIGYVFANEIELITTRVVDFGGSLFRAALLLTALYVGWKWIKRHLFLRKLRVARIHPQELRTMLGRGEEVTIVDLRHAKDFERDPYTLPGALRLSPEELNEKHGVIPRDRDVILYCT
jgi:membrane protein DedA with SNARE-associated domain